MLVVLFLDELLINGISLDTLGAESVSSVRVSRNDTGEGGIGVPS